MGCHPKSYFEDYQASYQEGFQPERIYDLLRPVGR